MSKPLPLQQFIPQQTIQSYLDALLQDATEDLSVAEQPEAAPVLAEATLPVSSAPAVQVVESKVEHVAPVVVPEIMPYGCKVKALP